MAASEQALEALYRTRYLGFVEALASILPVSPQVADRWGRLNAIRPGILAATALVHNLTLVARKVDDLDGVGPRPRRPLGQRVDIRRDSHRRTSVQASDERTTCRRASARR